MLGRCLAGLLPGWNFIWFREATPVQAPVASDLRWYSVPLQAWLKHLAMVLAVAAAYVITARLGLALALPPEGKATAVWAPSGIALAAVLLLGYRVWPGVWLGAFLGNFWDFFSQANEFSLATHLAVSSGIAVGSTLQPLLGAYLLRRLVGEGSPLDRVQSVFKFIGVALLMCLVASTVGVTTMGLVGFAPWASYGINWWTWWVGDTIGIFLVAPFILAWSKGVRIGAGPRRLAEAGLLVGLILLVGLWVFGGWSPWGIQAGPLVYQAVPPLAWAAPPVVWATFRFGQRGATTTLLLTSALAIWGASQGQGPFVRGTLNESLVFLQTFVGALTVMTLALAGVLDERQRAERAQAALVEENDVLAEIGRIVSSSLDINQVYEPFAQRVCRLIPFDRISIVIPNSEAGSVATAYSSGIDVPGLGPETPRALSGSPMEQVMVTRTGLLIQGEDQGRELQNSPVVTRGIQAGLRSSIIVPLISQHQVIGGLVLWSLKPNCYSQDQVKLAERIGLQIGGAIANAGLHSEVRTAEQTIRELSTPILQVGEQLLVVPLVGVMYPQRATQLTDQLLSAIRTQRARAVVIDVTGTVDMDPEVTGHLMKAVEAARLLGATTFLTGISTDVTHNLVNHQADMRHIYSMSDLQSGIEAAQRLLKQQVTRRNNKAAD